LLTVILAEAKVQHFLIYDANGYWATSNSKANWQEKSLSQGAIPTRGRKTSATYT